RPSSPSDGSPSASQVSPGEAQNEHPAAPSDDEIKSDVHESSDDASAAHMAAASGENSSKKTEKGSARGRYVKPLITGPLPPDHPANRRTPRTLHNDNTCNDKPINQGAPPVAQAQVAPNQIAVAVTQPQSPSVVER